MIVICYGMPRSASTFAFQLARDIAQTQSDQEQIRQRLPSKLRNSYRERLDEDLEELIACVPAHQIYVVKTHCGFNPTIKAYLETEQAKAIVSYRNPYDVVVSLKEIGEAERSKPVTQQRQSFAQIQSYADALTWMPYTIKVANSWLEWQDERLLLVPFVEVVKDSTAVAEKIAAHLGVTQINAANIVKPYLANRSAIIEFNVGQSGRGQQIFDLPENQTLLAQRPNIQKAMDRFVRRFIQ